MADVAEWLINSKHCIFPNNEVSCLQDIIYIYIYIFSELVSLPDNNTYQSENMKPNFGNKKGDMR